MELEEAKSRELEEAKQLAFKRFFGTLVITAVIFAAIIATAALLVPAVFKLPEFMSYLVGFIVALMLLPFLWLIIRHPARDLRSFAQADTERALEDSSTEHYDSINKG